MCTISVENYTMVVIAYTNAIDPKIQRHTEVALDNVIIDGVVVKSDKTSDQGVIIMTKRNEPNTVALYKNGEIILNINSFNDRTKIPKTFYGATLYSAITPSLSFNEWYKTVKETRGKAELGFYFRDNKFIVSGSLDTREYEVGDVYMNSTLLSQNRNSDNILRATVRSKSIGSDSIHISNGDESHIFYLNNLAGIMLYLVPIAIQNLVLSRKRSVYINL